MPNAVPEHAVREILNGVAPAVSPHIFRLFDETVGNVTVAFPVPPFTAIEQVVSVTFPLKLMVPSAAIAETAKVDVSTHANKDMAFFISGICISLYKSGEVID